MLVNSVDWYTESIISFFRDVWKTICVFSPRLIENPVLTCWFRFSLTFLSICQLFMCFTWVDVKHTSAGFLSSHILLINHLAYSNCWPLNQSESMWNGQIAHNLLNFGRHNAILQVDYERNKKIVYTWNYLNKFNSPIHHLQWSIPIHCSFSKHLVGLRANHLR